MRAAPLAADQMPEITPVYSSPQGMVYDSPGPNFTVQAVVLAVAANAMYR